jgi:hypothetical protein
MIARFQAMLKGATINQKKFARGHIVSGKSLVANRFTIRSLVYLMALAVTTACVSVQEEPAAIPDTIGPDQGMLVLVIDTSTSFQRLKFKKPGDVFATVATMNVPQGRSVRFISIPPGTYYWDRFEYATLGNYARYVDFTHGETQLAFRVKAGTISYPGDLYIQGHSDGYEVRLLDHSAMLLGDLNEQEKELMRKYGISYTGKGRDRFFVYYFSLKSHATSVEK